MNIGDCPHCFEICECGYAYVDMPDKQFYKFLSDITIGRKKFIEELKQNDDVWETEDTTIKYKNKDELYSCACGGSVFHKHKINKQYRCITCRSIHEAR